MNRPRKIRVGKGNLLLTFFPIEELIGNMATTVNYFSKTVILSTSLVPEQVVAHIQPPEGCVLRVV